MKKKSWMRYWFDADKWNLSDVAIIGEYIFSNPKIKITDIKIDDLGDKINTISMVVLCRKPNKGKVKRQVSDIIRNFKK